MKKKKGKRNMKKNTKTASNNFADFYYDFIRDVFFAWFEVYTYPSRRLIPVIPPYLFNVVREEYFICINIIHVCTYFGHENRFCIAIHFFIKYNKKIQYQNDTGFFVSGK